MKSNLLEAFGGGRRTIGNDATPISDAAFVVIVLVLIVILLGKDRDDGKKVQGSKPMAPCTIIILQLRMEIAICKNRKHKVIKMLNLSYACEMMFCLGGNHHRVLFAFKGAQSQPKYGLIWNIFGNNWNNLEYVWDKLEYIWNIIAEFGATAEEGHRLPLFIGGHELKRTCGPSWNLYGNRADLASFAGGKRHCQR